jgi:predicted dehydrogenase
MNSAEPQQTFRFVVLSAVKHEYLPRAAAAHPRFTPVAVADDPMVPDWIHERNQRLADEFGVPYVRDPEKAMTDYGAEVAVVSSEAERHGDLTVRAANAGLHVVQDKPLSNLVSECDRIVEAVERNHVKFLMWNRNSFPAVLQARDAIAAGAIGTLYAIHVDFYFSKDAGPPKGSGRPGDTPLDWLGHQIAANVDGSDGGVGVEPMGELRVEGSYPLAYIHMLGGADVKRVFALTTAHFHQLNVDNDIEDLASVTLEMERGLVGTLAIGRIGAASYPDSSEIKIHLLGSMGALVISEARPEIAIYYRGQPTAESRHHRIANEYEYLLMEDFAHAIDADSETILDARARRAISATIQAAIDSGRSGQPVDVG